MKKLTNRKYIFRLNTITFFLLVRLMDGDFGMIIFYLFIYLSINFF